MQAHTAPWTIGAGALFEATRDDVDRLFVSITQHAQDILSANRKAAEEEMMRHITEMEEKHEKESSHLKSIAYTGDKIGLRAELEATTIKLKHLTADYDAIIAKKDARLDDLTKQLEEMRKERLDFEERLDRMVAGSKLISEKIDGLISHQQEIDKHHMSEISRLKAENASLKKRITKRVCEGDVFDAISNGSMTLPKRRRSDVHP